MLDENFNIFVNNVKIDEKMLGDLAENTQFLWKINDIDDPFIKSLSLDSPLESLKSEMNMSGYIASVDKPSKLKIRGTQEKVTIDLFVNGRLREKDILRTFQHLELLRIMSMVKFILMIWTQGTVKIYLRVVEKVLFLMSHVIENFFGNLKDCLS